MSSPPAVSRRRRRTEFGNDDDADQKSESSSPSSPDSAKRARTNGQLSRSTTPRQHMNLYDDGEDDDIDDDDGPKDGESEFQPGAIVRVKLTNFVTYESAEFFPGPNLNMVIGPNGTGKSSLVCAICLGLGWGPSHLGRAQQIGEFVKHNTSEAHVEIELQKRPKEHKNPVVRLRIIKDGNNREWWLDDKKTSLKAVQALTRGFNIQVDNLCQFLPQDKVSEFAALSPVELLQQTQRAAAPEEMLEQHEMLKKLRKEQKSLERQLEGDKENLAVNERRQEGARAEVERLEERQQIEENVRLLKLTVPFVEYRAARNKNTEFKNQKREAQKRLKELEEQLQPTLQSVTRKENYAKLLADVVRDRRVAVDRAEKDGVDFTKSIATLQESIQEYQNKIDSERIESTKRNNQVRELQRSITKLKARLNDAPIEFDAPAWNERIRAKDREIRIIKDEISENKVQIDRLTEQGRTAKAKIAEAEQELKSLDTQAGQQTAHLKNISKETAQAWDYIQKNFDKFEKEIYGPPLISCSIKDPKYTSAVESFLHRTDLLTITAQTSADFKKLSHDLLGGDMKLADVYLTQVDEPTLDDDRPWTAEHVRRMGFEAWASDLIDGPDAVLSMLNGKRSLHRAAIALQDINDGQFDMISDSQLSKFVAGGMVYEITRRKEYGPSAVSTRSKSLEAPKFWTDQPVDASEKNEVQLRIDALKDDFNALKERVLPLRAEQSNHLSEVKRLETDISQIKKEKAELQAAHSERAALPDKIDREEQTLREKQQGIKDTRTRVKALQIQIDNATLKKAQHGLEFTELITTIRIRHEEYLEAEIMVIEARSDVAGLKERNADIVQHLEEERRRVSEAEAESARAKEDATRALEICQDINADPVNLKYLDIFRSIPQERTTEAIEAEIAADEARLEFVHANDPNAIKNFEARQADIDKLKEKIEDAEKKLDRIDTKITALRNSWEPALDRLVGEISDAFSYNFEQIRCAGEVSVHKDDDFDLWAIQIKVKFRENETLQLLDAHRQSGGERSVSTIFYLMSLQSLARAPFRVVDEINQGMDPRNERLVHDHMVDIACREHTSQYFLITPKLLTGLRYDKKMKVLCIASGEHMPDDHSRLNLSNILAMRRAIVAAG